MKKISCWARNNPWMTRFSIVILHILITGLGIIMGRNLQNTGNYVSGFLLCISLTLLIASAVYYPDKKQKNKYPSSFNFYKRQKTCDWMLAFSTFLVVGFLFNIKGTPIILSETLKGATIIIKPETPVTSVIPAEDRKKTLLKINPTRAERKALFKELRKVLKESLHKQTDKNHATRITLVVLTILGGVFLSFLLAALACSILCNGSETLAAFALIFGASAIAVLIILTIKAIFRHFPKNTDPAMGGKV